MIDTLDDRTPPHDLAAEQHALGGMLMSPTAAAEVADILTTGDFYKPAHATIFDAIAALDRTGTPVDPTTLNAYLIDQKLADKVGGGPYLHTLISSTPTAAHAGYYARIVAERAQLRRLIEVGMRITQLGYGTVKGSGDEIAAAVEAAQTQLHAATNRDRTAGVEWSDIAVSVLDGIEANGVRGGIAGLSTGITDLDRLTGGLRPGQLVCIAGRPGAGKSVAGINLARTTSFCLGKRTAFFSLEMSRQEIGERIASAETQIPFHTIRAGTLSPAEWDKLSIQFAKLDGSPLHIDDSADLTLSTIRARARRLAQRDVLDLIIVDYLQLLTTGTRTESRQQEVSEISRGMKLMAKELQVPVVAIAQLNRETERRNNKQPQLSDLRESGSIEQDCDLVLFVHREDYYDKESPRAGEADFIVAKHRSGPTDTITVASQLHYQRFVDMAVG